MPTYEYGCRNCRLIFDHYHTFSEVDDAQHACDECGAILVRLLSPPTLIRSTIPTGGAYNPSTGQFVRNDRELKDQLKAASEAASSRTGMEHNFQPVDLRDKEALGVTDEGLDATYARATAAGKREVRRWL